jgi:hypothetical protein
LRISFDIDDRHQRHGKEHKVYEETVDPKGYSEGQVTAPVASEIVSTRLLETIYGAVRAVGSWQRDKQAGHGAGILPGLPTLAPHAVALP